MSARCQAVCVLIALMCEPSTDSDGSDHATADGRETAERLDAWETVRQKKPAERIRALLFEERLGPRSSIAAITAQAQRTGESVLQTAERVKKEQPGRPLSAIDVQSIWEDEIDAERSRSADELLDEQRAKDLVIDFRCRAAWLALTAGTKLADRCAARAQGLMPFVDAQVEAYARNRRYYEAAQFQLCRLELELVTRSLTHAQDEDRIIAIDRQLHELMQRLIPNKTLPEIRRFQQIRNDRREILARFCRGNQSALANRLYNLLVRYVGNLSSAYEYTVAASFLDAVTRAHARMDPPAPLKQAQEDMRCPRRWNTVLTKATSVAESRSRDLGSARLAQDLQRVVMAELGNNASPDLQSLPGRLLEWSRELEKRRKYPKLP